MRRQWADRVQPVTTTQIHARCYDVAELLYRSGVNGLMAEIAGGSRSLAHDAIRIRSWSRASELRRKIMIELVRLDLK